MTEAAGNRRTKSRVLRLAVRRIYFEEIQAGTKTHELRLHNAYWSKRLIGRSYDTIEITLGYPRRDDASRRLSFPWDGFSVCSILHPEFGAVPVTVFKIHLLKQPA